MKLYRLNTNGENKVWKRYFTFAERYIYKDKELKLVDFASKNPLFENVRIQALCNGDVVKDESLFVKEKMPPFLKIEKALLIKEDLFDVNIFSKLAGVRFLDIGVDGTFSKKYKLLIFDVVVDCINEVNSKRGSFEYLSTLVFDAAKVPTQVDGFFLKNWNQYGKYETIVNERVKDVLLSIPKAKDFLIFNEVVCTNN